VTRGDFALTVVVGVVAALSVGSLAVSVSACYTESQPVRMVEPTPPCGECPAAQDGGAK
jgi:hypothetical protein